MNITTSLDLSRKLYELGVRMDTYFYWTHFTGYGKGFFSGSGEFRVEYRDICLSYPELNGYVPTNKYPDDHSKGRRYKVAPAPTAEELGAVLPDTIGDNYPMYGLMIEKIELKDTWYIRYGLDLRSENNLCATSNTTLANAMAKMLILLLENGHISVEQVNGGVKA